MNSSCKVETFYGSGAFEEIPFYLKSMVVLLSLITLVHAPFLILMPFINKSSQTNSRRIIAMISLSDLFASLLNAYVQVFKFPEEKHKCFLVTQMILITRNWSEVW